jgi:hypothetical protein
MLQKYISSATFLSSKRHQGTLIREKFQPIIAPNW